MYGSDTASDRWFSCLQADCMPCPSQLQLRPVLYSAAVWGTHNLQNASYPDRPGILLLSADLREILSVCPAIRFPRSDKNSDFAVHFLCSLKSFRSAPPAPAWAVPAAAKDLPSELSEPKPLHPGVSSSLPGSAVFLFPFSEFHRSLSSSSCTPLPVGKVLLMSVPSEFLPSFPAAEDVPAVKHHNVPPVCGFSDAYWFHRYMPALYNFPGWCAADDTPDTTYNLLWFRWSVHEVHQFHHIWSHFQGRNQYTPGHTLLSPAPPLPENLPLPFYHWKGPSLYPALLPVKTASYPFPDKFPWHLLHSSVPLRAEVYYCPYIPRSHYAIFHLAHPEDLQGSVPEQACHNAPAAGYEAHILLPPLPSDMPSSPALIPLIPLLHPFLLS